MRITKKDSNLVYGKKATDDEKALVALGLEKEGLTLCVNGDNLSFTVTKDRRTLKCSDEKWTSIPYGTEVEVEIA